MDRLSRNYRTILLIVFIILSVFADYLLIGPNGFVSILAPSIGLILIYHMYYRDNFIVSLLVYALTLLLSRFLVIDEGIGLSFFVAGYKTFVLFCMIILMDHLLFHLRDNGYKSMSTRDIWNYIFVGVFVSFVGATLHLIPIFYVFEYENSFFWYGNSLIGYMFGFFIFGASLHFAFVFDTPRIDRKGLYLSFLFLFITLLLSILLYSHIFESFNHLHFSYLFFVVYLIGAIFLNFRIIFIANYIVFGCYGFFQYSQHNSFDLSTELMSIIITLLVLTGFSVLVKYTFVKAVKREKESVKLKDSIKNMMYETSEILKNVENISTSNQTFSNDFLIKMFRMGTRIVEKFDRASVFIKEKGTVKFVDSIGYDINYLNSLNLDEEDFVWTYIEPVIVKETEEMYSSKFTNDNEYKRNYAMIDQSVRFTIMYDGNAVAGMSFDILKESDLELTSEDLESFKELSQMINSFYDLVVVQDSKKEFKNDIVISLVRALGLYDSYTGKHSEEVAFLSLEISKKLNLSNSRAQRIYWSAIVHDIGKIGVSYSTITKDGKLTEEEREEVQKHSIFGYNILRSVDTLKDVADRVKHHHERWDGGGYPDGLKGYEISLCSQVLAVCDAVSAMSRDRSYSRAKSVEGILKELQKERGKQFSPKVCDAMIEYIEESNLVNYFMQTT